VPVRVEHVDGVIGDALDQDAELFLAPAELFLRCPSFGQIAGDFRITDQGALRRADRVDDDARPEARAVLADPPSLTFEAAFLVRYVERALGKVGPLVLFGIKAREMLAEDFALFVTFEAPRARVPACDDPVRIQHVDGVVGDASTSSR